jgi:hypothetical protein
MLASAGSAVSTPPPIDLPGAAAFDADLQQQLRHGWAAIAPHGKPRTMHFNPDGSPQYINRLVFAASPYLQQHAFNPVNWYPWGEEAFAAARRENKPIFLSIGYSTCHWCHVMERECFENEAIARALNEHFIAIKVDREERPDIDSVYIAAVQRMTGSGGWPLSVFLTPDRQPFYGGTYFPPEDRNGLPGFPKLLKTLADAWQTQRDQVVQASAGLTQAIQQSTAPDAVMNLGADTLRKTYEQMQRSFDATNGGFGRAPKFPQAHMLQFLLRYAQRAGASPATPSQAIQIAEETLDHMARGGICDQLGGGFHRYSTDAQWHVPHFEKMLYDQAINARAYLEATQATGTARYAEVARQLFTYVLRDLTAPSGGFYAAEDADSDGEEGRFYTWSRAEMIDVAGKDAGALIADFFGVADKSALPGGRSPLSIPLPVETFVTQHHLDDAAFEKTLEDARQKLLTARNRRVRPLRDEKIITAWNGLMISSLAYGSTVLNDTQYATAAARAADFVLSTIQRDGRLLRSFRDAPSATPGYLDDYAFFILGLTDLYSTTLDVRWLREADRLTRDMLRLFADPHRGGLRSRANDHEPLIAAVDDTDDAALPSGQSVAALVLVRLGRLTMNDTFDTQGRAILAANSADLAKSPTAHTEMLMALDFVLGPTQEIVVAGRADAEGTQALLRTVRHHYLPRAVLALHPPDNPGIEALVPFVKQQPMINDKPTAYVCEHYVCKLPTNDPQKLDTLLTEATKLTKIE